MEFTSFSPNSGPQGSNITLLLAQGGTYEDSKTGLKKPVAADSLQIVATQFTSDATGESFQSAVMRILDPIGYTAFEVQVPEQMPDGECQIQVGLVSLDSSSQPAMYTLSIAHLFVVDSQQKPIALRTLVPNMVTVDEVASKVFLVMGDNLSAIDTAAGMRLVPGLGSWRLRVIGEPTDDSLRARLNSPSVVVDAGRYRLSAHTETGEIVTSTAFLTVKPAAAPDPDPDPKPAPDPDPKPAPDPKS